MPPIPPPSKPKPKYSPTPETKLFPGKHQISAQRVEVGIGIPPTHKTARNTSSELLYYMFVVNIYAQISIAGTSRQYYFFGTTYLYELHPLNITQGVSLLSSALLEPRACNKCLNIYSLFCLRFFAQLTKLQSWTGELKGTSEPRSSLVRCLHVPRLTLELGVVVIRIRIRTQIDVQL